MILRSLLVVALLLPAACGKKPARLDPPPDLPVAVFPSVYPPPAPTPPLPAGAERPAPDAEGPARPGAPGLFTTPDPLPRLPRR